MRPMPILCAILMFAATPALAQVTLDLHALQALPDHPPAHQAQRPVMTVAPRMPAPPAPVLAIGSATPAPAAASVSASAKPPAAAPAAPPALPQTEPQTATLAPIVPPPATVPPPPPPVSDQAATTATATHAGLRLNFAPGQSELSPDSSASLKQLATATPTGDTTTFNVLAYAPGAPDDPSTARRVSLARAMAVRGALVADGVASARIFVRALGAQYGAGPPDRVDIDVTGEPAPK